MLDNRLDIFYGDTSPVVTHVYARVSGMGDTMGLSLSGYVRGPYCEQTRTLPTTVALSDLGRGESLLARAVIPDPCFWSPDVPSLYEVVVELRQGTIVIDSAERQLGIRWFGPKGRSLYLDGKRWVLRGVSREAVAENDLTKWREAGAAMVADQPDDALCEAASRCGVFLAARLPHSEEAIIDQLRRLARWAAVGIVIFDDELSAQVDLHAAAPNICLAQSCRVPQTGQSSKRASLLYARARSPEEFGQLLAERQLPVVACREYDGKSSFIDARAACDRLQRDLAPFGEFAGFVV